MSKQESFSDHGKQIKINAAIERLIACYDIGGKLMICGNGGSAADCEHIVGELMKGFCLPRSLSSADQDHLATSCEEDGFFLARTSIWPASVIACQPFILNYGNSE